MGLELGQVNWVRPESAIVDSGRFRLGPAI